MIQQSGTKSSLIFQQKQLPPMTKLKKIKTGKWVTL